MGLNERPRHRYQIVPDHGLHFLFVGEEVMPWKECSVMTKGLQFVARPDSGEGWPNSEESRSPADRRQALDRYQELAFKG